MSKPPAKLVMLNLVQHPFLLPTRKVQDEKWALKHVQGDDAGKGEFICDNPATKWGEKQT